MAKYIEKDLLNVGFGVLNPVDDTMSGKYFDPQTTTGLSAIKNATKDFYSESILNKANRFVGVVLRVDGTTKQNDYVDLNFWASLVTSQVTKNDKSESPNLLQIRVRIPEVHSHLPVPNSLPDVSEKSAEHNIINLYHCFVAETEAVTMMGAPEPGSLVIVDFKNRATLSGPTYYGPVKGESGILPTRGQKQPNGSDVFAGGGEIAGAEFSNVQNVSYSGDLTTVTLSPAQPIASPGFKFEKSNLRKLKQNRVRRFAYGNCKREGPPLVPLPGGAKAHPLVATRLEAMNRLWARYVKKNNLLGKPVPKGKGNGMEEITSTLEVSNGFADKKPYPLNSEGFRAWCNDIVNQYQKKGTFYTCKEASVLKAFASPHETGLAIDFTNNGLKAISKTMATQVKSPAFEFLVKYAWLFGFYPYNGETWHWELQVPRECWKTGEEFAGNPKYGDLQPLKVVSMEPPSVLNPLDAFYTNTFSGEEYEWLVGEEFPYAIWVSEKFKKTGTKTVDSVMGGIRTWSNPPGAETFRLPSVLEQEEAV